MEEGRDRFPAITREQSIYSLTFEEFQNTLGGGAKDFGSMNMEELLKNICSAEESQFVSSSTSAGVGTSTGFSNVGAANFTGLQRQGSLMTLPRTISMKTVDEVWRTLYGDTDGGGVEEAPVAMVHNLQPHRQPTLGEITLEEFLVRAGVVREEPPCLATTSDANIGNGNNPSGSVCFGEYMGPMSHGNSSSVLDLGGFSSSNRSNGGASVSQQPPITELGGSVAPSAYRPPSSIHVGVHNGFSNTQGVKGGAVMDIQIQDGRKFNNGMISGGVGFGNGGVAIPALQSSPTTNPLSDKFARGNGDLSSLSPVPYSSFERGSGRKEGGLEKAVERRQKRMIKNRESAARSRARKQAYTIELEAEVAKLKEQNKELQKKQEILEKQKNRVLDIINKQSQVEMINKESATKKRCLRRTQTGPC